MVKCNTYSVISLIVMISRIWHQCLAESSFALMTQMLMNPVIHKSKQFHVDSKLKMRKFFFIYRHQIAVIWLHFLYLLKGNRFVGWPFACINCQCIRVSGCNVCSIRWQSAHQAWFRAVNHHWRVVRCLSIRSLWFGLCNNELFLWHNDSWCNR